MLGRPDVMDREKLVAAVKAAQQPNGGFGGQAGHDATITHTYRYLFLFLLPVRALG